MISTLICNNEVSYFRGRQGETYQRGHGVTTSTDGQSTASYLFNSSVILFLLPQKVALE